MLFLHWYIFSIRNIDYLSLSYLRKLKWVAWTKLLTKPCVSWKVWLTEIKHPLPESASISTTLYFTHQHGQRSRYKVQLTTYINSNRTLNLEENILFNKVNFHLMSTNKIWRFWWSENAQIIFKMPRHPHRMTVLCKILGWLHYWSIFFENAAGNVF